MEEIKEVVAETEVKTEEKAETKVVTDKKKFFKHNKNRIIQLTGELKSSQGNGDRIKE